MSKKHKPVPHKHTTRDFQDQAWADVMNDLVRRVEYYADRKDIAPYAYRSTAISTYIKAFEAVAKHRVDDLYERHVFGLDS